MSLKEKQSEFVPSDYVPFAILIVLVAAAFAPAFGAGFIWDDAEHIYQNGAVVSPSGLGSIWFSHGSNTNYYPVATTLDWLIYRISGDGPGPYHAMNIVLHAGNACLLYQLLKRLRLPAPLLAAALFAVHPVQVDTVAWVSELKNILALMFGLLTLHAYRPLFETGGKGEEKSGRGVGIYVAAMVCFAGAMLSKATSCTLPVVMLILLFRNARRPGMRELAGLAPFFVIAAALAIYSVTIEGQFGFDAASDLQFSWVQRVLIAGRAFLFYPQMLLVPYPLMPVYRLWTPNAADVVQWIFPVVAVGVVVLPAILRWRGIFLGVCAYAALIVPALGFVSFSSMKFSFVADHYQYAACVPLLVLLVAGVQAAVMKYGFSFDAQAARALVVAGPLAVLTFFHTGHYRDRLSLWSYNFEHNPSSWIVLSNLGHAYLEAGQYDMAISMLNESIKVMPDNSRAYLGLGAALMQRDELVAAEGTLMQAIKLSPGYLEAWTNLAITRDRMGKLPEAVEAYRRAIEISPEDAVLRSNLAACWIKAGKFAEGETAAEGALAIDPGYLNARVNLAIAQTKMGHYPAAIANWQNAVRARPGFLPGYLQLAICYGATEKPGLAVDALRMGLSIDPKNSALRQKLVEMLRQAGRAEEAAVEEKRLLGLMK